MDDSNVIQTLSPTVKHKHKRNYNHTFTTPRKMKKNRTLTIERWQRLDSQLNLAMLYKSDVLRIFLRTLIWQSAIMVFKRLSYLGSNFLIMETVHDHFDCYGSSIMTSECTADNRKVRGWSLRETILVFELIWLWTIFPECIPLCRRYTQNIVFDSIVRTYNQSRLRWWKRHVCFEESSTV